MVAQLRYELHAGERAQVVCFQSGGSFGHEVLSRAELARQFLHDKVVHAEHAVRRDGVDRHKS